MSYEARAHLKFTALAAAGVMLGIMLGARFPVALGDPPPVDPVVAADYGERHIALLTAQPARTDPPQVAASDDSPVEVTADAAWWSWKRGYVGLLLLALLHFGGAHLYKTRGRIVKRWPRLDVGRAWAVLSVGVASAGTLIPLAIAGDLTQGVLVAQLAASAALLTEGKFGAPAPVEPPT